MGSKRHSKGRKKVHDSSDSEPLASGHKLRARSSAVSYKESDDEFEDDEEIEKSAILDREIDHSDTENDVTNGSLARNLRLKIPRRGSSGAIINGESIADEINDEIDDEDDEDDEEDQVVVRKSRESLRSKAIDDDEYVEDEQEDEEEAIDDDFESEEDKLIRKDQEKQFIATDDEDFGFRTRRKKRKVKRRSFKKRKLTRARSRVNSSSDESYKEEEGNDSVGDEDSLKEELEDLKSSEPSTPPKKQLRERKKPVNYQIPPPLPDNSNFDDLLAPANDAFTVPNTTARRKGPRPGINRGLFSVAGPFGGNDIEPIFGENAPPGMGNNVNLNDSSSSDDDFVTRPFDSASGAVVGSKGKKQKNSLSDSDPLGIQTDIDFSSVGGLDGYINQLKEMVALPLLYPEVYDKFGITPPRGVLFHGPPGTGKTLMARALASSCSTPERKITFFMRKGADCLSKWVGEAERQLRLLFEEAKTKQPSIIFFDEIDGLAPVRSSKQEQIHASIVSTLLALMDGMDNRGQVIVIGATNRPDAIDPALRRPGRFDREFYFALPDLEARTTILNIHTKKWDPKPDPKVVKKLADLTKGYGGSDIRALCTEAALNSIKRSYPQIYDSDKKLLINPDLIEVHEVDFFNALDKIVPSSSRSSATPSNPIPEHLIPLLERNLESIVDIVKQLVPGKKVRMTLDFGEEDETEKLQELELEKKFGMSKHDLFKKISKSRVFNPRLLISGKPGMGQKYIGAAVLNYLEGFQVHTLDLSSLFSDSGRSPEAAIIQTFLEARRNTPSVVFIPNLEIWVQSVSESAKSTFEGLLRSTSSSEQILVLGLIELEEGADSSELEYDCARFFGMGSLNQFSLKLADSKERAEFFKFLWVFVQTKPVFEEFADDPFYPKFKEIKEFKKGKKLHIQTVAETAEQAEDRKNQEEKKKQKELVQQYKADVKLKNMIKVKLSAVIDMCKVRYKRFKKPVIPLQQLAHLFDPSLLNPANPPQFVKDGDMILDLIEGKRYYNMDLDTIEERIWNGFYSEPKQFLKDMKMVCTDSQILGDRERIFKANELFVNVQLQLGELFNGDFLRECKDLRSRELAKEKEIKENQAAVDKEAVVLNEVVVAEQTVNENKETEIGEDDVVMGDSESGQNQDQEKVQNIGKSIIGHLNSNEGVTVNEGGEEQGEGEGESKDSEDNIQEKGTAVVENEEVQKELVSSTPEPVGKLQECSEEQSEEKAEEKPIEKQEVAKFSEEELAKYEQYLEKINANKFKEIILDREKLKQLEEKLVEGTEGFSTEQLEHMNSLLSEIIWRNRNEWDRNKVLEQMEKKMEMALKIIGK